MEFHLCDDQDAFDALDIVGRRLGASNESTLPLVGFSPGIEQDLDDSAKASIIMSLSGKLGSSQVILEEFSAPHSLRTYRGERNPSVSANCNALLSLLVDTAEYEGKSATIQKIVKFIYDSWMEVKGEIKDKWVSVTFGCQGIVSSPLSNRTSRLITR